MPTARKRAKQKRAPLKPGQPGRRPSRRNFDAALWSVPMCVQWSGFSYPHVRKLIRTGVVSAIALGPEYEMNGHRRTCAKFLVPAQPFRAFVEGLGTGSRLTAKGNAA
jgi:hypothetical protein